MIPPFGLSKEAIGINRDPYTTGFIFYFENGDSYALTPEEAERYMELLDEPVDLDTLDYVQNFGNVIYFVQEKDYKSVTKEQLVTFMESMTELVNEGSLA